MRRPQVDPIVALIVSGVALVVFLMATLLASVASTRGATTEVLEEVRRQSTANGEQVGEHRGANQTDHDAIRQDLACVVELALLLSDPNRDRSLPIEAPSRCRLAPDAPPGVTEAPAGK